MLLSIGLFSITVDDLGDELNKYICAAWMHESGLDLGFLHVTLLSHD